MAEPNLKKRKIILDPIFEDFRKNTPLFNFLKNSVEVFVTNQDYIVCRFLEIIGSNAQLDASFSRASCSVRSYTSDIFGSPEVTMLCSLPSLFTDGKETLEKYLDDEFSLPCEEKKEKALKKLLHFFNTGYKDFKPKADDYNECEWAVQLAQHLLSKLAICSEFVMEHHYSKNAIKSVDGLLQCPCEMKDTVEKGRFGDTSFGCTEAWHGSVDILFENTSIKVSATSDNRRSSVSSDDDSQSSIEAKTEDKFNDREDEQILAQCIVFSFLQRKRLPDLKNFLIPSLAFNRDKVRVTFYDCEHDVLLQTPEIGLFSSKRLNGTTIVFLWLVLNYRYFCSGLADPIKEYKAKFFDCAGNVLAKYRNEITRHVTKISKDKDEGEWWRMGEKTYYHNPSTTTFYKPKDDVEGQDQHT